MRVTPRLAAETQAGPQRAQRPAVPRPRHQHVFGIAIVVIIALSAVGCSDSRSGDPGAQTEEQVIDRNRNTDTDLWVSATVTVTSDTTRRVLVHVENKGAGGMVDDVRVHLDLQGPAVALLPLPETCSNAEAIECRLGWLSRPPAPNDPPGRASFADLEFTFDIGDQAGAQPPTTLTVTVDASIGGGYEERDIDETPEDNIVTVEL
jgi:hypothetical protein